MQAGGGSWEGDLSSRSQIGDLALIAAAILGLHLGVMRSFPIIYGGDPVTRLVNFPKILMGHQLPLLQILIYAAMRWLYGPLAIWALMGCVSALAGSGLYVLTGAVTRDRRAARVAAFLYAVHPFTLYYSLVPYQEALLFAGIAWGSYFLLRAPTPRTLALSSLFFGAACFARYEGWIAATVAAIFFFRRSQTSNRSSPVKGLLQSIALFGWAPATWVAWNGSLSPAGSYVLDLDLELGRLYRPYFIAKSTLWWTESAVVCLALVGLGAQAAEMRRWGARHLYLNFILGYLVLFSLSLIASGHGIDPDPIRLVTEREAFIPIAFLLLFAGSGGALCMEAWGRTLGSPYLARAAPVVALAVVGAYGLNRGIRRVAETNSDPTFKTDYEAARFLVAKGSRALVFAAPLPEADVQRYIHNVERAQGERGREAAQKQLREVEGTPLDYQRILLFSWMGRDKIVSSDRFAALDCGAIRKALRERQIDSVVVLADFMPSREHEKCLLASLVDGRQPLRVIRNGSREARIYSAGGSE